MDRTKISDSEWVRILSHLTKLTGVHLGSPDKCRRFMGASLWILRTGAQWRTLPPEHGKWIASSSDTHVGVRTAPGIDCSLVFLKMLIYRIFLLMERWRERTPVPQARRAVRLKKKRWGAPKVDLAVRFMRPVMRLDCRTLHSDGRPNGRVHGGNTAAGRHPRIRPSGG